jgi:hypothetical protein
MCAHFLNHDDREDIQWLAKRQHHSRKNQDQSGELDLKAV